MRVCPVVRVQCKCALINWCWLWSRVSWSGCALSLRELWPFATPPPLAWQRPSSPRLEWRARRRGCQWLLIVWRWTLAGSVVVVWVWCGCGGMSSTSLCAFNLGLIGIVCRLQVGFRWLVKIFWLLEEQDGAVVGVFWPLPSSPASGPLSILNAHFWL